MLQAYFLMVFVVLFPKGGIKAIGTPLTWGYVYLALSAPFLLLIRLLAKPLRARGTALAAVGLLLPMQILMMYALLANGYSNTGYAISMVVGLVVFPWLFLLIYPPFFELLDPVKLSACFRFCMLAAALWGIFLFFLHPFYGHYIEIPYLTVNADDYGLLETTKYNARGFYLKLISTYNNGNLYGVATLILLPLYNSLEPRFWRRSILLAALLLTLSRTVWVGLILMQVAPLGLLLLGQLRTFPVLYLGAAGRRLVGTFIIVGLVLFVLFFTTNSGIEFLLDPTLGGRAGELNSVGTTFLPAGGLVGFDESLYGSAARYYGLTGVISFTLIMFSPLLLLVADSSALRSPERMAAFTGLMLYAVVAASDGAFVLIPVTAFYWFAYSVFLYGWPGTQTRALVSVSPSHTMAVDPNLLPEPS